MANTRLLCMAAVASIAAVARPALAADPVVADPRAGKDLFSGSRRLRNGGPACAACHAIGSVGAGSLGPDLSHSFDGTPPEAIDGLLQDLPFPTMVPIYAGHPLTPEERADLAAFFAAGAGVATARAGRIFLQASLLAVLGFAALAILGRRRKRATREQLTPRAPYAEQPPRVRSHPETVESAGAARASGGLR